MSQNIKVIQSNLSEIKIDIPNNIKGVTISKSHNINQKKESSKLNSKENNKVNFNDCVQFLHLRTGKFLSYRTYDEYLKTYIELTDNMSKNTIFRFTPAFVYQTENSTNVFFDLTIQIACGEKKTRNEKFISNIRSYKEDIFKKNKSNTKN